MTSRLISISIGLVAVSLLPAPACACSTRCAAPRVFVGVTPANVPVNTPGLRIDGSSEPGSPMQVRLLELSGGAPTLVRSSLVDGLLVPTDGFREGADYEVEIAAGCGGSTTLVTITGAALLPRTLGTTAVDSMGLGGVSSPNGGSCSSLLFAAYVDVSVAVSDEVGPWTDLLVWETLVDGVPYAPYGFLVPGPFERPESWMGRGVDRVYAVCEIAPPGVDEGVAPGVHEVVFRASIPGTDVVLETAAVSIELSCPEGGPIDCSDSRWAEMEGCRERFGLRPAGCGVAPTRSTGQSAIALVFGVVLLTTRRRRHGRLRSCGRSGMHSAAR